MRAYAACAALTLFLIIGSVVLHAAEGGGGATPKASGAATLPVIDVWYGNDQQFGVIGTPQRRANVLGSVSHPVGISSLKYTLNGGAARTLSFQPDDRRIYQYGDFNIDLKYDELYHGVNTIVITAIASTGESAQSIVTVRNLSGQVWPLPYSLAWTQFTDSVQIVDGKWAIMGGGARILEPGYDRLIAIGDTTWKNYEVTATVTVWGIDSTASAFDAANGGPGLGFLLRWKGHTGTPVFSPPISQPLSGYTPSGAICWYHWGKGYGNPGPNQWQIATGSSNDFSVRITNNANPVYYGAQYYFKAQVNQAAGAGPIYKIKAWLVGDSEPSWLLTWQEPLSAMANGSLLLLAHHVMATFGPVTITLVPDGIPPVISDIVASTTPTTATITWTTDEASTSSVSYGLTSSYGSGAGNPTLVTGHSIQLQNLQPNTEYHYAVTSADFGGASATSRDSTFRTENLTLPAPPVIVAPGNGSAGNPTTLTLRWNRSATATGYRVQLGTDATFATGIVVHDSTLTDTLRAVSGLVPGAQYYWRVSARNSVGEGAPTPIATFTTALAVPLLASPANGALNISPTPRLTWHPVANAVSYRVRVSSDSLGGAAVFDDSLIVDTSRVASGMQVGQKYYWQVRAKNNVAIGAFSSPWAFTTGLPLAQLLAPGNGSSSQPVNLTFSWRKVANATAYGFQLATDSTFVSGLFKNDSTIVDTTRPVANLANKTIYYWRVRPRLGGANGTWSLPWKLTTIARAVTLIQLADGVSGVPNNNVRFIWTTAQPGVNRYWFEMAIDSNFTYNNVDSSLVDTTTVVNSLTNNTTYFWRVRAGDDVGWDPFSPTRHFHVGTVAVEPEQGLPKSLALEQNYPNPFNPSTRIRFALPSERQVRLEVYSVLGERVATLVDDRLSAGIHAVEVDGSRMASGVYYYRLITSESTITKKMVLVK